MAKAVKKPRPKILRCTRGFKFKKIGRNKIALMRANNAGPTFNCSCDKTGGCKVTIDNPQTISCLEDGCKGTCGWVIKVPGIGGGVIFRELTSRR